MLCQLAHSLPPRIAAFLERDRKLARNFREETITDLLMASLIGLEPFGIRVDFPDEPLTGGDMEWIFAAPGEINGGRYFRLIVQAKRAQFAKTKTGGYWYYHHLDHGTPPGQQAQTLLSQAWSSSGSSGTLPLYIFYHPKSALAPASGVGPAIEGANVVFASDVAPVVSGGCQRKQKKVEYWRVRFMPLSDLLCWPIVAIVPPVTPPAGPDTAEFFDPPGVPYMVEFTGAFHPDIVARRLRDRYVEGVSQGEKEVDTAVGIEPPAAVDGVPPVIRRAIERKDTPRDREMLKRPRVIFSTKMKRRDPGFERLYGLAGRRG
jgi:hypothetical protein